MTRKEQIIEILENHSFCIDGRIYKSDFWKIADAILALPLDVPSDTERDRQIFNKISEISEMTPFTKSYISASPADYMRFISNWMRDEIIKRNS